MKRDPFEDGSIGQIAGKVWMALAEKGEVPLSQLPRVLGMKGETAFQGLGWLAREGKIDYRTDTEGKTRIALSETERLAIKGPSDR